MSQPDWTPQPNEARGEPAPQRSVGLWVEIVCIGALGGLAGAALLKLLKVAQHLGWGYHEGTFDAAVARAPWWRHVAIPVAAGVIAAATRPLVRGRIVGHGGGLSEAIWFEDGKLPLWKTVGRAVVSIVCVAFGTALGREGALKQTGAAIAATLSGRTRRSAPARRLLVACGAASGIAAAYNVPFGGALFGLEVLLGSMALELALPMLVAVAAGTIVARAIDGSQPTYELPHWSTSVGHVAWAAIAGPIIGAAAAGWVRVVAWVDALKPRGAAAAIAPAVVLGALGAASLAWPQLLGNGKDLVHAALLTGVPTATLAALLFLRPLGTAACLGAGVPGGLFTPTLCVGVLVATLLALPASHLVPSLPPTSLALIGMTALLAGSTHGPLSSVVLGAELTDGWGLVLPMLLASWAAVTVSRLLDTRSLYTARLWRRMQESTARVPPPPLLADLVSNAMAIVSSATRATVVLRRLVVDGPMYVVDGEGALVGRVDREAVTARAHARPHANLTAADLAAPVDALVAEPDGGEPLRGEARARPGVPVVEPRTHRPVGVTRAR